MNAEDLRFVVNKDCEFKKETVVRIDCKAVIDVTDEDGCEELIFVEDLDLLEQETEIKDLQFEVLTDDPQGSSLKKGQIVKLSFEDDNCLYVTHNKMHGHFIINTKHLKLITPTQEKK